MHGETYGGVGTPKEHDHPIVTHKSIRNEMHAQRQYVHYAAIHIDDGGSMCEIELPYTIQVRSHCAHRISTQ